MIEFKYEVDMYPLIKKYFIHKNKFVMEQVRVWNSYADTMVFDINWDNVEKRLQNQVYEKLDAPTYWNIIFLLEKKSIMDISRIAKSLKLTDNYIRALVKDLHEFNVVDINEDDVRLLYVPSLIYNNSIVIESKLFDWRTCLKQAYYYNNVCNNLFMAFPLDTAEKIIEDKDKLARIQKRGVGIYGLNDKNVIKLLDSREFQPNPILKTQLYMLNEQVWSSLLSNIKYILREKSYLDNLMSIDSGNVPIERLEHLV